jgi:predicted TPR repeat methyltransferase
MKLYSEYAWACHKIYAETFDYAAEFRRYDAIFKNHDCHSVLELACGTGLLAPHLIAAGYEYLGIDLHEEMLAIARQNNPSGRFLQGDMRHFDPPENREWDGVLIAGRGFYHLTTNNDVLECLTSVARVLRSGGILAFEIFDAMQTFTNFRRFGHRTVYDGEDYYKRKVHFERLFDTGWTQRAREKYTVKKNGVITKFRNDVVMRAFLPDEICLFLCIGRFEMQSCTPLEGAPKIKFFIWHILRPI